MKIKIVGFVVGILSVVVLMSIGSTTILLKFKPESKTFETTCVFISIYSYLGIKLFDILEK